MNYKLPLSFEQIDATTADIQKVIQKRIQDAEKAGLLKPTKTINMGSVMIPGKTHKVSITGVVKL